MSLHAIARELESLAVDLRHLESRVREAGPVPVTWVDTHATAQIDALHVRLDALAAEVHGYQALSVRAAAARNVAAS